MNEIVYSTSAPRSHAMGWDAFDRMVLWAVSARPGQVFDEVLRLIPDGVLIYLVRLSVEFLIRAGLVARRRARTGCGAPPRHVYAVTPAGRDLLNPALREAA